MNWTNRNGRWNVKKKLSCPYQSAPQNNAHTHTNRHLHQRKQVCTGAWLYCTEEIRDCRERMVKKKKKTEHTGWREYRMVGNWRKWYLRGGGDHKRQLRENNILQVMRPIHTRGCATFTLIKKSHIYKLVPLAA